MNVFEKMKAGVPVNMEDEEYKTIARKEMERSREISYEASKLSPNSNEEIIEKLEELFNNKFPKSSFITPPFMIDRAINMKVGENVFINHSLDCMSSGGITIEDNVMIGPEVALMTVNHDFKNLKTLDRKSVV